jgi:copper chaperone CopZ
MSPNTQTHPLSGLHCSGCVKRLTEALQPFAQTVAVTLEPMQVRLEGLKVGVDAAALQAAVAAVGNYSLLVPVVATPVQEAVTQVSEPSKSWLQTYYPLLLILAFISCASVLVQVGQGVAVNAHDTMRYFMAGFFLVFAFFKLLDVPAFASAYAGYDLLAARWHGWGTVYPFVELALGIAYLTHWQPTLTAWITIIVMGFSAAGVMRAVLGKRTIRCACLGTVFQLPMSTVTIIEDVGMVVMAVWMLAI